VPFQQRPPAVGGERVGERAHRKRPLRGQVDPVHGCGERDEIARALRERFGFGRVGGPVGVQAADLLSVDRRVPRVRLALHPVAGGKQLPADARMPGDLTVELLGMHQRRLRRREERGGDGGGKLRLVGGDGGPDYTWHHGGTAGRGTAGRGTAGRGTADCGTADWGDDGCRTLADHTRDERARSGGGGSGG